MKMSEAATQNVETQIVKKLRENIESQVPFPQTTPQPVDSQLVDYLRNQVSVFDSSIAELDESIAAMQARRTEYQRARARCNAALDLNIDSKVIDG
jgi:hypothetical protein